jgi:hypothetical protein
MSLGTLAVFDLVDCIYTGVERTPVVGTLVTPVLLPISYAWRHVPDDRDIYVPQVTPGRPECRLTYGSLATEHSYSMFPNARSWSFTFATPGARKATYRAFYEEHKATADENRARLKAWHTAEEERRKYNDDALDTLRKRNRDQQRQHAMAVASAPSRTTSGARGPPRTPTARPRAST